MAEQRNVVSSQIIPFCEGPIPLTRLSHQVALTIIEAPGNKNFTVETYNTGEKRLVGCAFFSDKQCTLFERTQPCKFFPIEPSPSQKEKKVRREITGISPLLTPIAIPDLESLRNAVHTLRTEAGLPIQRVSNLAEVDPITYRKLETGKTAEGRDTDSTLKTVEKVLYVFRAKVQVNTGNPDFDTAMAQEDVVSQLRNARKNRREHPERVEDLRGCSSPALNYLDRSIRDPRMGHLMQVASVLRGTLEIRPIPQAPS